MHLNKATIDACFEQAHEQADYIIALYTAVFPDWGSLEEIDGYPSVSEITWKYICRLAMDFDLKHHPSVQMGGAWLNWGFRSNARLKDWYVSLKGVEVRRRKAVLA